ncbi:DNA polymerase III subunit delta [Salinibacterium sp. ZJ70]|uniref:DNA polymerase III subunit delta n=1 Tax=Salinibacterium sp. ZJ70 TaxID=2708084 RepID=UPI0014248C3D|nr:DNA polymerase III subunit delta [Salinibacterium sp. ZJ70]
MAVASKASKSVISQVAWHAVTQAPVVLVTGPETLLADRAVRALRDGMRAADPSLEVSDIDAGQYAPGQLLTLASPSLFGEPRLIRVSQVEKCTDAFLEEAISYLSAPADDTVVVLRHGGGVRGKKLLDAIRSGRGGGIEVVCAELKREGDKIDFANAEFRAAKRKVTAGAVRALVAAFTDDLAELAAACRQLISDTDGDITEAVVDKYYSGRSEVTAFAVADAAIAGRAGEALGLLRHALSSGSDPVPMVAAFAMKIRTMAKLAGSRGSSNDLARQFGLQAWQVDRARRDLQGWSDEGLARAISALASADAEVKGAGRDPVYSLERLVGVIASRGAR